MANANTQHSRRLRQETAARWNAERIAEGYKRVTVMLPPASAARLERLARRHGSAKNAIITALKRLEENDSPAA